jgi:transcriptional regulator with XRE-family HTH domain
MLSANDRRRRARGYYAKKKLQQMAAKAAMAQEVIAPRPPQRGAIHVVPPNGAAPFYTQTIGQRLLEIRETAGMEQELLALRADLSQNHISHLETDVHSPKIGTLQNVLQAMGTDLRAFFTEAGVPDKWAVNAERHQILQEIIDHGDAAELVAIDTVLERLRPPMRRRRHPAT